MCNSCQKSSYIYVVVFLLTMNFISYSIVKIKSVIIIKEKKLCKIRGKSCSYVKHVLFCAKNRKTSTTPSCSGLILAQKIRGNSVPGAAFSHTMPNMDFYYSHRFSWEKTHLIDISHAISIIISPLS